MKKLLSLLLLLALSLPLYAARDFNGSSDKAVAADAFGLTNVPLTICAYFNADTTTVDTTLVSIAQNDTSNYISLFLRSTGPTIRARMVSGGAFGAATTSATVSTGAWHSACGVYVSSSDYRVYLDGGNKVTFNPGVGFPGGTLNQWGIAVDHLTTDTQFFDGKIAEIGVWNVALTDDEVAAYGSGFSPPAVRSAGLVAYVPIDGNSTEINWCSATALTLTGTAVADHPRMFRWY